MKYVVTEAVAADAHELTALVNSAYRGESARAGWTHESDLLDGVRITEDLLISEIADAKKTILCVRERESELGARTIIATVNLEWVNDDETGKPGCYLGMLTVNPLLQAKGLGKFLLESAETFARGLEKKFVILGVIHTRGELIAWYERRGYQKTGLVKPFPYENPLAQGAKRFDLTFVFLKKSL